MAREPRSDPDASAPLRPNLGEGCFRGRAFSRMSKSRLTSRPAHQYIRAVSSCVWGLDPGGMHAPHAATLQETATVQRTASLCQRQLLCIPLLHHVHDDGGLRDCHQQGAYAACDRATASCSAACKHDSILRGIQRPRACSHLHPSCSFATPDADRTLVGRCWGLLSRSNAAAYLGISIICFVL